MTLLLVWWRERCQSRCRGWKWINTEGAGEERGRSVWGQLHTTVCEKPCLRKMQAGPTMRSTLQFFTSALKGSWKSLSSPSPSSSPSGRRPCRPTALLFPSTTPFRGHTKLLLQLSDARCLHSWLKYNHIFQGKKLRPTLRLPSRKHEAECGCKPALHKLLLFWDNPSFSLWDNPAAVSTDNSDNCLD